MALNPPWLPTFSLFVQYMTEKPKNVPMLLKQQIKWNPEEATSEINSPWGKWIPLYKPLLQTTPELGTTKMELLNQRAKMFFMLLMGISELLSRKVVQVCTLPTCTRYPFPWSRALQTTCFSFMILPSAALGEMREKFSMLGMRT